MTDLARQRLRHWLDVAPIEAINPADPMIFLSDLQDRLLTRMRDESPIHYCSQGIYGEFWSIARYKYIVEIENQPSLFSSADGFMLEDAPLGAPRSFMRMDPPEHQQTRRYLSPLSSREKLDGLRPFIAHTVNSVLDALPLDCAIEWVDVVAAVISRRVFTHVMGLPVIDAELLEGWAKAAMTAALNPDHDLDEYQHALAACSAYFHERCQHDLDEGEISMLSMLIQAIRANGRSEVDLMADLMILLIGGIETVRHAMAGSALLFHRFPAQFATLRGNMSLLTSAMSEVLRLQTPFAYMRRTATQDIDFHGVTIKRGSKVALWYAAANRDEEYFLDPHAFCIERENSGAHLSFGSGPHHCVGKHLALLELEGLWRGLIERGLVVQPVAPAEKLKSSFINGYASLQVKICHAT
jgi:cytochrome P450